LVKKRALIQEALLIHLVNLRQPGSNALLLVKHLSPSHLFLREDLVIRVHLVKVKTLFVHALLVLQKEGTILGRPEGRSQHPSIKCELIHRQNCDCGIF
jgi:hypothetical protein